MERLEIRKQLDELMLEKFGFHAEKLSDAEKTRSLLNPNIGFQAIDILVLFMEVERNFNIRLCQEDVVEKRFDIYNNILDIVENHMVSDSKESVSIIRH